MKAAEVFSSSLNGYNKKEVVAYLEKLSADMEKNEQALREEKDGVEEECSAFAKRVHELLKEKEELMRENESLSNALANSKKQTDKQALRDEEHRQECEEIKRKAQNEADEKIAVAEKKAEAIIFEAEEKSKQLLDNASTSAQFFADVKREELGTLLNEIHALLDDLSVRSNAVSSCLEVSKRHIEGVNRRFEKIICDKDE